MKQSQTLIFSGKCFTRIEVVWSLANNGSVAYNTINRNRRTHKKRAFTSLIARGVFNTYLFIQSKHFNVSSIFIYVIFILTEEFH